MPTVALGDDVDIDIDQNTKLSEMTLLYRLFFSVYRCLLGGWLGGLLRRL